jgi:hypothetical protein
MKTLLLYPMALALLVCTPVLSTSAIANNSLTVLTTAPDAQIDAIDKALDTALDALFTRARKGDAPAEDVLAIAEQLRERAKLAKVFDPQSAVTMDRFERQIAELTSMARSAALRAEDIAAFRADIIEDRMNLALATLRRRISSALAEGKPIDRTAVTAALAQLDAAKKAAEGDIPTAREIHTRLTAAVNEVLAKAQSYSTSISTSSTRAATIAASQAAFMVDSAQLWERFVEARLQSALTRLKAAAAARGATRIAYNRAEHYYRDRADAAIASGSLTRAEAAAATQVFGTQMEAVATAIKNGGTAAAEITQVEQTLAASITAASAKATSASSIK